jgi:hypothetical protein
MRFSFHPVPDPDSGDGRFFMALVIDTPSQQVHVRDVGQFCSAMDSRLTHLETIGKGKIASFVFNLHATKGHTPPSLFLDVLCTFLQGRAFLIADNRRRLQPVGLLVRPPGGIVTSRSEGLINEATYKICRAFWENESVRAANFVHIDIPATPSQGLMNDFLVGGTGNGYPHANLRVSPTPGTPGPGRDPDLVQFLRLNANCVNAAGRLTIAEVASRVLDSSSPAKDCVKIAMYTSNAAGVVAASLRNHRNHMCKCLGFVRGDRQTLVHGAAPVTADRYPMLDGVDLCAAALCCPSVNQVWFEGFQFSSAAVAAQKKALKVSVEAPTRASLRGLSFLSCAFVQPDKSGGRKVCGPVLGICDLVLFMSRPNTLGHLKLLGTPLGISDVKSLCGMLTDPDCRLTCLDLGGQTPGGESCLRGDGVLHFFKQLPSMNSLKALKFEYDALSFMAATIRDGLTNNYVLERLEGLTFELEVTQEDPASLSSLRLQVEMVEYANANAKGRGTVAKAAVNPGSREHHEEALMVLHRLSKTGADDTYRYLCVRVLLPAYCARNLGRGP